MKLGKVVGAAASVSLKVKVVEFVLVVECVVEFVPLNEVVEFEISIALIVVESNVSCLLPERVLKKQSVESPFWGVYETA